MGKLTLDAVKNAVRAHVPEPVGTWRHYSVLLPLVEKHGEPHVLYELRSQDLDVQPGEACFPGGAIEDGETPEEAALRETAEELGLPVESIEIITELDYLVTHHNLMIHCFLGVIDEGALDAAAVNTDEVAEFFLVPLVWLLENRPATYLNRIVTEPHADLPVEKLYQKGNYNWRTGTSAVHIYTWPGTNPGDERVIWGMTARLTKAFVELLTSTW